MYDVATQAAAEAARRKIRRASGLLKDAVRDIAALAEGQDALGVLRVHDGDSGEDARALIELGVAQYGSVDVVVITRPRGRCQTPPTAADAAKENRHGASHQKHEQQTP